jgi:hypothetical protein
MKSRRAYPAVVSIVGLKKAAGESDFCRLSVPADRRQLTGGLAQSVFPGSSCLPSKGASAF